METKFVKMSQIDFKEDMDGQGNYTFYLQYNNNEENINKLAEILDNCHQYPYGDTSQSRIYINRIYTEKNVDEYCKAPVDNYYGRHFKLTGKMLHVPLEINKGRNDMDQTIEIDKYLYKNGICNFFPESIH